MIQVLFCCWRCELCTNARHDSLYGWDIRAELVQQLLDTTVYMADMIELIWFSNYLARQSWAGSVLAICDSLEGWALAETLFEKPSLVGGQKLIKLA